MSVLKKYSIAIISLLIVIGLIFVMIRIEHPQKSPNASDMPPSNQAIPVKLLKIEPKKIPLILHAFGTVLAPQAVTLRTQVSGVVSHVNFHPGQTVQQGRVLIQLDPTAAIAALNEQTATLQNLQAKLNRYEALIHADPDAVSQESLDVMKTQLKAQAALVAQAKKAVADMEIRAPFTGVISAVSSASMTAMASNDSITQITQGAYLNAGDAIANLINPNPLEVTYAVPQEKASDIALNQLVLIDAQGLPNPVLATVTYISPSVNPVTRTLTLHAALDFSGHTQDSERGTLKPGTFVSLIQVLNPDRTILAVPGLSVIGQMSGFGVFEVIEGRALWVPIELGDRFGSWVAVESGIHAGDSIVVQGQDELSNGAPVVVKS